VTNPPPSGPAPGDRDTGLGDLLSGDLVSGALAAAFGLAVLLYVQSFPQLPGGAPGPGLFPGIVGGLLLLLGLVLVFRAVRAARRETSGKEGAATEASDPDADPTQYESLLHESLPARTAWLNALSVTGAVIFYLLFADVLGFAVTMVLLLVGLMLRLGARPVLAVLASLGTTAFLYVVFEAVLLVPLPHGILG
jgi:putative tricarboxylic transport membrane protein